MSHVGLAVSLITIAMSSIGSSLDPSSSSSRNSQDDKFHRTLASLSSSRQKEENARRTRSSSGFLHDTSVFLTGLAMGIGSNMLYNHLEREYQVRQRVEQWWKESDEARELREWFRTSQQHARVVVKEALVKALVWLEATATAANAAAKTSKLLATVSEGEEPEQTNRSSSPVPALIETTSSEDSAETEGIDRTKHMVGVAKKLLISDPSSWGESFPSRQANRKRRTTLH